LRITVVLQYVNCFLRWNHSAISTLRLAKILNLMMLAMRQFHRYLLLSPHWKTSIV
jgi:hypothetical protein